MNKMRENTAVVLWILVFAFGGLWVLQDSGAFDNLGMGIQPNIAEVNGQPVSYEEYNRTLNSYIQQYQAQTGEPIPPQMQEQYRDMVFDALVDNALLEQEINRLGIRVSDTEVIEMVMGEAPDPFIVQQFGDGEGGINRNLLRSVIDNPDFREDWIQIEEYLRSNRRQAKLENLIMATIRVTERDVEEEFIRRNKSASVEFIGLRYAGVPDDEVEVSERDLRAYYNENREDFRRPRTYRIEYASIPKEISETDSAAIVEELEDHREAFGETDDPAEFLETVASAERFVDSYFRPDELDEPIAVAVFQDPSEGRIVGPIVHGDRAHLIRILETRPTEETVVHVRHILLTADEGDEQVRAQAREQAEELLERLRAGEDFAELAQEYSDDPGSAARGGDLGWFGPGVMVRPFEEAAFDTPIGDKTGPIESAFGIHILEVLNRTDQEVQMASLVRNVQPVAGEAARMAQTADDFQFYASERGDIRAEGEAQNIEVEQVTIQEGQEFVPGIGSSRALMSFLERARRGHISEAIELDDKFIVAQVREIEREGYRPFDEVASEIEPRVLLQKKRQVQSERLRAALAEHGLEGAAEALDASVERASGISYRTGTVPTLGREPKFIGTALGLRQGSTSRVVEGENSAFVVRVTDLDEPDLADLDEEQRSRLRQELTDNRRQQFMTEWLSGLRDEADIRDYRARFTQ